MDSDFWWKIVIGEKRFVISIMPIRRSMIERVDVHVVVRWGLFVHWFSVLRFGIVFGKVYRDSRVNKRE